MSLDSNGKPSDDALKPAGSGAPHSIPPPLPPSSSPEPRVAVVQVTSSEPKRTPGFGVLTLMVMGIAGAAGAWLRFHTSSKVEVQVAPPAPSTKPTETAPPPAAAVVEVPAQVTSSSDPAACVASHFPSQALGETPDLGFVCSERDAWKIAEQLRARVISTGNTAGVALWSGLGRYELAVAASLKSACCPNPGAIDAPIAKTPCGSLVEQLQTLGPEPNAAALGQYEAFIQCLVDHGVHLPEQYTAVTGDTLQAAKRAFFLQAPR